MINPRALVDSSISRLQSISGFVAALGGNATRITAYAEVYPQRASVLQAVQTMLPGSALLIWLSSGPGNFGRNEVWQHSFSLILRAPEDAPDAYYDLWRQFCNGVPAGGNQNLRNINIHPHVWPMNTPRIDRKSMITGEQTSLDYFEITYSLNERGDSQ